MRPVILLLAALVVLAVPQSSGSGLNDGPQTVLVMAGTWGPRPFATSALQQSVFVDANRFVQNVSFGRVSIVGDVTPWLSVKQFPSCDFTTQGDIALTLFAAARQAGYDPTKYSRYIFVIPLPQGCAFAGFGAENEVFLFGTSSKYVIQHELGHTFGLPHAFSIACKTCRSIEYGDAYDEMGHGHGHYNSWEKALAGWLTNITNVTANGDYTVDQIEQKSSLPQALVVKTAGNEYWLDHREPLLEDAEYADNPIVRGLEIHASPSVDDRGESIYQPRNVFVVNPTGDGADAILPGRTWGEAGAFRVSVLAHEGTSVRVHFEWTDTTPPARTPVYSPAGRVGRGKLDVEWGRPRETGSGVARFEVRLDKRLVGTVDGAKRKLLVARPKKKGKHTITVLAVDRAGNRGTAGSARFSTR